MTIANCRRYSYDGRDSDSARSAAFDEEFPCCPMLEHIHLTCPNVGYCAIGAIDREVRLRSLSNVALSRLGSSVGATIA